MYFDSATTFCLLPAVVDARVYGVDVESNAILQIA